MKFIIFIAIILVLGLTALLLARSGKISPKAAITGASLSISPSAGNYAIDEIVTLDINIDTAGQMVDGADIVNLNYPADKMELQSLTAGNIFNVSVVTQAGGIIALVATVPQGSAGYSGSGVIAEVKFKIIAGGTANLTFDYTPGSTRDCNIAEHGTGQDLLARVINGEFILGGPTPAPTAAAGTTYITGSATAGVTFDDSQIGLNVVDLSPSASGTVSFQAKIN